VRQFRVLSFEKEIDRSGRGERGEDTGSRFEVREI
jgi:hypothetical protein